MNNTEYSQLRICCVYINWTFVGWRRWWRRLRLLLCSFIWFVCSCSLSSARSLTFASSSIGWSLLSVVPNINVIIALVVYLCAIILLLFFLFFFVDSIAIAMVFALCSINQKLWQRSQMILMCDLVLYYFFFYFVRVCFSHEYIFQGAIFIRVQIKFLSWLLLLLFIFYFFFLLFILRFFLCFSIVRPLLLYQKAHNFGGCCCFFRFFSLQ